MPAVYPKLYTCDLARGRPSSIVSDPDAIDLTAQNLADGDPNSLWNPGATAAVVTITLAGARFIRGYAISNHNLLGAEISVEAFYAGIFHGLDLYRVVETPDDFLHDFTEEWPSACTQMRFSFRYCTANILVGCLSIIADYGYDESGVLVHGTGYGIIELGGDDVGRIRRDLPVSFDSGIRALQSGNGFTQFQQIGSPFEIFTLPLSRLRASRGGEMWRLANVYSPRRRGEFTNKGFGKGVWFTDDTHSVTARSAKYCVGEPSAPFNYNIDTPGARSSSDLVLRTPAREAVS